MIKGILSSFKTISLSLTVGQNKLKCSALVQHLSAAAYACPYTIGRLRYTRKYQFNLKKACRWQTLRLIWPYSQWQRKVFLVTGAWTQATNCDAIYVFRVGYITVLAWISSLFSKLDRSLNVHHFHIVLERSRLQKDGLSFLQVF